MKTYIIESIKYPIEIIFANNSKKALKQYAKDYGFKNIKDLEKDCEKSFNLLDDIHRIIRIERLCKSNH
jgi:hypothetical protein